MVDSTVQWKTVELRDEKPTLVGTFRVDESVILEATIVHEHTRQGTDVNALTLLPRLKHYYTWHISEEGEPVKSGDSTTPFLARDAVMDACRRAQEQHVKNMHMEAALAELRHEGEQQLKQILDHHRASQRPPPS